MTRRLLLSLSGFFMSLAERLAECADEDFDVRRRARWALEQRHTALSASHDGEAWHVRSCGRHLRLVDGKRREDQLLIAALMAANAEQAMVIKILSQGPDGYSTEGMRLQ